VLTTSRFPHDAALRYAREPDFPAFSSRLEIVGPLELANVPPGPRPHTLAPPIQLPYVTPSHTLTPAPNQVPLVEAFCDAVVARFPRIHVLVNPIPN